MDTTNTYANNLLLLATNPSKLYHFISTTALSSKIPIKSPIKLRAKLVHYLPNILYSKIMQSINTNDISFETQPIISFENNNYLVDCIFKDAERLHILNNTVNNQINFATIQKSANNSSIRAQENTNEKSGLAPPDENYTIEPDQIIIHKYKKIVNINDKIFSVTLYENIIDNTASLLTDEIFEQTLYKFNQIVKFPNGVQIIAQNNDTYSLEYEYELVQNVDEKVKHTIQFMINLLSGGKKLIIQNDIFIDNYKHIMNIHQSDKILKTVNPINISIEILLDKIDMSHCVFEKTDGERVHILVYDGIVCYLNTIMEVYLIGQIKNTTINKIFDAELYNSDTFYIFNVLYDNENTNIRDLSLPVKLDKAKDFIENHEIDFIRSNTLSKDKNTRLFNIQVKTPIYNSQNDKAKFFKEIHALILKHQQKDAAVDTIRTDGIIFQSVLSANKTWEKRINDYKWKPIYETSLDFLVRIDKNRLKTLEGDFFKLNLYGFVHDENGNETIQKFAESNVLINPNENEIAHVYPVTSNRDINEIICDNCVVEFNPEFDDATGTITWTPFRIRMDKSLAVFYYKRKQGNSIETCKSTVEYLEMYISESDFENLGNNYEQTYEQLAARVQRIRVVNKRDPIIDRLFDFVATNVLTSFARWHAHILRIHSRVDMCDLNCGNGINLFKIYEYAVLMRKNNFYYYGFNENRIQINSVINGAISRYEKFRADKTYSNFPICTFNIYSLYQILENVNTKFNNMMCLDAYTFQTSKSKIITISKIMRKLLVPRSFVFFVLANESFNIDDKTYNINCDYDTCISIFTKNSTTDTRKERAATDTTRFIICEQYTLDEHIHNLEQMRNVIPHMNNKKTAEFLSKTLTAYDKLKTLSLLNFRFLVLYKPQ